MTKAKAFWRAESAPLISYVASSVEATYWYRYVESTSTTSHDLRLFTRLFMLEVLSPVCDSTTRTPTLMPPPLLPSCQAIATQTMAPSRISPAHRSSVDVDAKRTRNSYDHSLRELSA